MRHSRIALCCLVPALLCAQEGRTDEALFAGEPRAAFEAMASRIEALKPKDAKLLAEAGRFHFLAGNIRKGEEALRFAEMLDPSDADVARLVGKAWLQAGRRREAMNSYEKLLNRENRSRRAIASAGIDLAEAGMAKEAARFMDAYVLLDNDWETFVAFGRALLKGGSRRAAAPWFSRATVLKPTEEKVYLEVGRALAEHAGKR